MFFPTDEKDLLKNNNNLDFKFKVTDQIAGKWKKLSEITRIISGLRSDEGLTHETSASETLYGGQFKSSTLFIKKLSCTSLN